MLFLVLFITTILTPIFFVLHITFKSRELDLRKKVVLVTGGCDGLGQQICIKLAEQGCSVIVVDSSTADETMKKIEQFYTKAKAYKVNMSNYKEILRLKQEIAIDFGKVDILINCTGDLADEEIFEKSFNDLEKWIQDHIKSVLFVSKLKLFKLLLLNLINKYYPSGDLTQKST